MPPPTTDTVDRWLVEISPQAGGAAPLSGDVSSRCYFRCRFANEPAIVAYYPDDLRAAFSRFLATTHLLQGVGLRVPRVLAHDEQRGLMLVDDVGSNTLYEAVGSGRGDLSWLGRAASYIPVLQTIDRNAIAELSPPLDAEALEAELSMTWTLFLAPNKLVGSGPPLRQALRELCHELGGTDLVPCHRDFMARNLVVATTDQALSIIDHQDLRLGPTFYDLASLLNDSLFAPPALEDRLLALYAPSEVQRRSYHRSVVQRGLKAIGTFRRFADRGHGQHLPLIRPTLRRVWRSTALVPELAPLRSTLEASWRVRMDEIEGPAPVDSSAFAG